MKRNTKRKNEGITLIALVITIIVLLILAGVTIATLTGDNGVLTKATQAKEQTIVGQEKEAISLAYTACKSNDYTKDVESKEMQKELEKNQNDVQVSSILAKLNILFKDTKHRYTVDQNGNIEQIHDLTPGEADKIVDMLNANIGITAGGKVIYIEADKVTSKYAILDTTNRTTITEEGIKELGENYLIDNAGKLYTWGENYYGQLGNGTTESSSIPVCISDLDNDLKGKRVDSIYIYGTTRLVIDEDGKLYTWGANYYGRLGDGTTEIGNDKYRSTPICISELDNDLKGKSIEDLKTGHDAIIAIDNEGKLYTWGANYYGRLGDGTTGSLSSSLDDVDDEYRDTPLCISDLENDLKGKKIVEINSGSTLIARDEEGKVYTWGDNYNGELGDGMTGVGYRNFRAIPMCISDLENDLKGKKIVEIHSDNAIIARDVEGKIYTWGENYEGQLGNGTTKSSNIPICISDLENDLKGKKIVEINSDRTIIARDEEGKIYTWGENYYGQLGNGTMESSSIPVCISDLENDLKGKKIVEINRDNTIIARDEEGKIYTWGENRYGQLGNGTMENSSIPVCINDLNNDLKGKKIVEILDYTDTTMIALDEEGKIYTWGENYYGKLGNGTMESSSTPVCISDLENDLKGKRIVDIIDYDGTMVALDEEGKVYTWGSNNYGQVGDGMTEDRNTPRCLNDDENSILHNKVVNKIKYLSSPGKSAQYCNYITEDGEIIYFLYYQDV